MAKRLNMRLDQIKVGLKFIVQKDRSRVYEIVSIDGDMMTIKHPDGGLRKYTDFSYILMKYCDSIRGPIPFKIVNKWKLQ